MYNRYFPVVINILFLFITSFFYFATLLSFSSKKLKIFIDSFTPFKGLLAGNHHGAANPSLKKYQNHFTRGEIHVANFVNDAIF